MGRPVNIFLPYYALDAFRTGRLHDDHKLSPEATDDQARDHPFHLSGAKVGVVAGGGDPTRHSFLVR